MSTRPPSSIGPLNIGNVVSAGVSLYRSNFKTYTGLGAKAMLWNLIPIYGWARSLMIAGQIGRLGFQELIHQPEPVPRALAQVEPRLWSFLGVTFLVSIIQIAVSFAASIAGTLVLLPFMLVGALLGEVGVLLTSLINLVIQLVLFAFQLWVQARFLVYDLVIAIETDQDAINSISRSWLLSQGSALRVQGVLLITYLILMPIFVLCMLPLFFVLPLFAGVDPETLSPAEFGAIAAVVALVVFVILVLVWIASIFMMPFFQSIKAVLYYDLRSRREGLDIRLVDRGPTDESV